VRAVARLLPSAVPIPPLLNLLSTPPSPPPFPSPSSFRSTSKQFPRFFVGLPTLSPSSRLSALATQAEADIENSYQIAKPVACPNCGSPNLRSHDGKGGAGSTGPVAEPDPKLRLAAEQQGIHVQTTRDYQEIKVRGCGP